MGGAVAAHFYDRAFRSWLGEVDMWRSANGLTVLLLTVAACGERPQPEGAAESVIDLAAEISMNRIAESYVKLVLAVGLHDADYVDAYYGPVTWQEEVETDALPLDMIRLRGLELVDELDRGPRPRDDELVQLRFQYLTKQLQSLVARVRMLEGEQFSFDEESRALYDATAPSYSEAHFQRVLDQLETLLPGDGPLHDRYAAFRDDFIIPADRVDRVFRAAIEACRSRTLRYLPMPDIESFDVEYVTAKPWSGYNWYQGRYRSLIQVNTDLPIYIDRAVDLACHEGYPGHHVYNVLLEQRLMRERGWVEYSVYPLFSPQSLIAEGSANYGIEVALPGEERLAFERDTLFPLAGLDPARAGAYRGLMDLVDRLGYAGNEAARRYLNGEANREEAATWLVRYAMMPRPRAEQRVDFFDAYRSYVINYNLGQDLVRDWVERGLPRGARAADRWRRFAELLASPRLPSGLQ